MLGETKVTRVYSDEGRAYHHEPEFDPEWSELMQLRWEAAIENIDIAPFQITVQSAVGHSRRNGITIPELAYSVSVRASGWGFAAMTFDDASDFIERVSIGIQMERRRAKRAAAPEVHRLLSETTPIFDRLAPAEIYRQERRKRFWRELFDAR